VLINWFTVIAQIVNFLILVVLLKYLLYDRIIKAMDERRQRKRNRPRSGRWNLFGKKTGISMRSVSRCSRRQRKKPTRDEGS
jgi:hypothetical protein